jgi:hypothetical protein
VIIGILWVINDIINKEYFLLDYIMFLPSKTERDLIGIDTFERAIVFSALLLRKGLRQAELPTNQITIYQNLINFNQEKIVNLALEIKLPYNTLEFLSMGGNFLNSILPFSSATIPYIGEAVTPTLNNRGRIPDDPPEVDTLEKYLAWSLTEWVKFTKTEESKKNNWDSYGYFSFLEEASTPVLSAKLNLSFDYSKYIETKNLIASVIRTVSFRSQNQNNSSLIGNNNLIGNNLLIGN